MIRFLERKLVWLPLFFPAYLLKGELLGVPINALEVLILVVAGGFLTAKLWECLGDYYRGKFDLREWARGVDWGVVAVAVGFLLLIGIGWGQVPGVLELNYGLGEYDSRRVALGIIKGWLVLPLMYFVALRLVDRKYYSRMAKAFFWSAVPLVAIGLYQFFSGEYLTPDARVSGPFINANYLAMYLLPVIVLGWGLTIKKVFEKRDLGEVMIYLVPTLIYVVVMIMTQSYGGFGGTIVGVLVLTYYLWGLGWKVEERLMAVVKYFLLVILAGVGVLTLLFFASTEKGQKLLEFEERSSSAVRLQIYEVTAGLMEERFWWGLGLGQFEPQYNLRAEEILGREPFEMVMLHPHNIFVAFWSHFGILGVIWLMALLVWIGYNFEKKNFWQAVGVAMMTGILVHGQVDTYFFKNDLAVQFWLIVAISLFSGRGSDVKMPKN